MQYLWEGKKSKISYNKLLKNYEEGGLKLVDVRIKNTSLKAQWFVKAMKSEASWAKHANSVLPIQICDLVKCNMRPGDVKRIKEKFKYGYSIWFDIWEAWTRVNVAQTQNICESIEADEILVQFLWFNSDIKIGGNASTVIKPLYRVGVKQIKDVFDTVNRTFYTIAQITAMYQVHFPFIEYYALIGAIPKDWKQKLKEVQQGQSSRCENGEQIHWWENFQNRQQPFTKTVYWYMIGNDQSIATNDDSRDKWV